MRSRARLSCFLASVGVASVVACGDTFTTAQPGAEGSACYPNGTCDENLTCVSNTCVRGSSDAGEGPATDAPSDVVVDARTEEASVPDAAPDGNCAPIQGGFCASLADASTFCADFDNPSCAPGGGFDSVITGNGAVDVEIDPTRGASTPASLHVSSVASVLGTGTWGAAKAIQLPQLTAGGVVKVHVQVAFLVTELPEAGAAGIGPLAIEAAGGTSIAFYMERDKTFFSVNATDFSMDGPAVQLGKWHEVTFDFSIDKNATVLSAAFDGASLFTNQILQNTLKPGQDVQLVSGITGSMLTTGEIWIDNLAVQTSP